MLHVETKYHLLVISGETGQLGYYLILLEL